MGTQNKTFTEEEILIGFEKINATLIHHGLTPMTLEQYKETLNHPISDEIFPRYPTNLTKKLS